MGQSLCPSRNEKGEITLMDFKTKKKKSEPDLTLQGTTIETVLAERKKTDGNFEFRESENLRKNKSTNESEININNLEKQDSSYIQFVDFKVRYSTETLIKTEMNLPPFDKDKYYIYKISPERINKLNFENSSTETFKLECEDKFFYGFLNERGDKHGFGILMTKKGEKYEGYFENNSFQPYGRYINEFGDLYEGEFLKWHLCGQGKMIRGDKEYVGEFFNGKRQGFGKLQSENEEYEGYYMNDKKEGFGKLYFKKSESRYTGDFKKGTMTGKGEFIWKNGDRYKGSISDGLFNGRGHYYWADGMEYDGYYHNGIRKGYGMFKWKDGRIYKGEFENNIPHGIGVIIKNGVEMAVKFFEGNVVKKNFKQIKLKRKVHSDVIKNINEIVDK